MKRILFLFSLPLLFTACGDKGGDPPTPPPTPPNEAPAVLLSRENPIRFSAAATESYTVTVTSDLAWKASSDKAWCKVISAAGKFTVSADPNTSDREPDAATVSIEAGGKTCAALTVTQEAELTEYPATIEALQAAVCKTWVFDKTGTIDLPYESLTLMSDSFLLVPVGSEVRSQAPAVPVISGTYVVSGNLRALSLLDREQNSVCNIRFDELHAGSAAITVAFPNGNEYGSKMTASPVSEDRPSARRLKSLKAVIPGEGTVEFRFTWQDGRLAKIEGSGDGETAACRLDYAPGKLTATLEGRFTDDDGVYDAAVTAVYTLDAQGRAVRIAATDTKNKTFLGAANLAYNSAGRLCFYESTDDRAQFVAFCQATWTDGDLVKEYVKERFDWDPNGDGVPDFDLNGDGVYNQEDILEYTWNKVEYRYSPTENVAGLMLPFEAPEVFSFDFDDDGLGFGYIGYLAGVMGPGTKHLLSNAGRDFRYEFDAEGYPTKVSVVDGSDSFDCTLEFAWPE